MTCTSYGRAVIYNTIDRSRDAKPLDRSRRPLYIINIFAVGVIYLLFMIIIIIPLYNTSLRSSYYTPTVGTTTTTTYGVGAPCEKVVADRRVSAAPVYRASLCDYRQYTKREINLHFYERALPCRTVVARNNIFESNFAFNDDDDDDSGTYKCTHNAIITCARLKFAFMKCPFQSLLLFLLSSVSSP